MFEVGVKVFAPVVGVVGGWLLVSLCWCHTGPGSAVGVHVLL